MRRATRRTKIYKNAPAVEVLFSIQVLLPEGTDIEKASAELDRRLEGTLGQREAVRQVQFAFNRTADGDMDTSKTGGIVGHRYMNKTKTLIGQFTLHGLFVNFLAPYKGYDKSLPSVKKLWAIYVDVLKPVQVVFQSQRYINVLRLPIDAQNKVPVGDYLTVVPDIPRSQGMTLDKFFMEFMIRKDDTGLPARYRLAAMDPEKDVLPIGMDIEAFKNQQAAPSDKALWLAFDELHDWCNELFDKITKPQCKQLFH